MSMCDMLVRLYELNFDDLSEKELALKEKTGIKIVRCLATGFTRVSEFAHEHFPGSWESEVTASFYRTPVSCFVAVSAERKIVGFACYDATALGFFGPTGVKPELQGLGIGTLLLRRCMQSMREVGYGYAIIGGVGPAEFYAKTVGAEIIPRSYPGVYTRTV